MTPTTLICIIITTSLLSILLSYLILTFYVLHRHSHYSTIGTNHSMINQFTFNTDKPQNVALIIAHPDDETMFFIPTLQQLRSHSHNIHVLCMCNGSVQQNQSRTAELLSVCKYMNINEKNVWIVDDKLLPDGIHKSNNWSTARIAQYITIFIKQHLIDIIITFDSYGVSGHINHQATYYGVLEYLTNVHTNYYKQQQQQLQYTNTKHTLPLPPVVYTLQSQSLIEKYIGMVNILLVDMTQKQIIHQRNHSIHRSVPLELVAIYINSTHNYYCMSLHTSQFVWYRKLFVYFSSYTYINKLELIDLEQLFANYTNHDILSSATPDDIDTSRHNKEL